MSKPNTSVKVVCGKCRRRALDRVVLEPSGVLSTRTNPNARPERGIERIGNRHVNFRAGSVTITRHRYRCHHRCGAVVVRTADSLLAEVHDALECGQTAIYIS